MTKAGVSEKDIAKVVALGPELLGCNIAHKLDVNVKYFLSWHTSSAIGWDDCWFPNAAQIQSRCPSSQVYLFVENNGLAFAKTLFDS